ncbi:hypothetical protein BDR05DRAFT_962492 [Suillus weaverae]|nr:hypothetical protein BDR05DRAFT_962492 [Suillus weaverae]
MANVYTFCNQVADDVFPILMHSGAERILEMAMMVPCIANVNHVQVKPSCQHPRIP